MMERILVVDDDRVSLSLIRSVFRGQEVLTEFAENGPDALALAMRFRPDLVILDIMMPGLDGYEVCRRIKADERLRDTMVMLLSAKSGLEDRLRGYDARADDYIIKPYDATELKAKARILLRLKRAQDDLKAVNRNLEALVAARTRELIGKERQAVIGQMVQGIVHNLQGPLTVARGRAEMSLRDARTIREEEGFDPAAAGKLIDAVAVSQEGIVRAVDRVGDLIRNLLIKSRQDALPEKQDLDLNELIRRELDFLEADAAFKHKVRKETRFDPDLPPVTGIYADFSQLVYNMVTNAMDAMQRSDRRELCIATRFDEGWVYIDFQDTGEGVAPECLDRIFEPFFTTKAGSDRKAGGTGLGLYTCRQLMRSYGGRLSVRSAPGDGATFTATVPRSPAGTASPGGGDVAFP